MKVGENNGVEEMQRCWNCLGTEAELRKFRGNNWEWGTQGGGYLFKIRTNLPPVYVPQKGKKTVPSLK